jgi:uncharacterized lipoprotein YmbA
MILSVRVVVCTILLLAGCFRSPPVHFYSLQALPQGITTDISKSFPRIQIAVESFPSYLSNPQLALRTQTGEIILDEYNRWVEEGKVNFEQILREDLSARLDTSGVFIAPAYEKRDVDQLLRVEVMQFDVSELNPATTQEGLLKVRWALNSPKDNLPPSFTVSVFKELVTDPSPASRVVALSKLVATFSDQVATRVGKSGAR